MGRTRLQTTVDEDLLNWFKLEWCPKHGKQNLSECLELAFSILKQQDVPVDEAGVEWKKIVLRYDATCMFCGKSLPKGSEAYWAKGVGVCCIDCYVRRQVESLSDKTLIKKYVTKLELEKTINALRNELKALAELYRLAEHSRRVSQLMRTLDAINNELINLKQILYEDRFDEYLRSIGNRLDELVPILQEIKARLSEIEFLLQELSEGKSKVKRRAREVLKEAKRGF